MEEIVIIDALRTPIGKLTGALSSLSAVELGTIVTKELIKRNHLDEQTIDQVIFGNVLQAGSGQNVARQIQINSGIPNTKTAMTINQVCGSGLKAIKLAHDALKLNDAKLIIAGGTESMTNAPYLNRQMRAGNKFGSLTMEDSLEIDGLIDAFSNEPMGITAENVADKYQITRTMQDEFAVESHQKARLATEQGNFKDEIIPISITNKKQTTIVETDESIRFDSTIEKLSRLKSAFKMDGLVTAGNSAPINDGAAALIMTTKAYADELGLKPIAKINDYVEVGTDPALMGYAPYYAINQLLDKIKQPLESIDLFEINEAFAAQAVAVARDLKIPADKLNIGGGALALGHPLGASGARIVTTLIHNLIRTNQTQGVAAICIGGGMGMALKIETI